MEAHNHQGNTPLHDAVSTANLEIITTLINAGANIKALNHQGDTPLSIAARGTNPKIFSYLFKAETSASAQNKPQDTHPGLFSILAALEFELVNTYSISNQELIQTQVQPSSSNQYDLSGNDIDDLQQVNNQQSGRGGRF